MAIERKVRWHPENLVKGESYKFRMKSGDWFVGAFCKLTNSRYSIHMEIDLGDGLRQTFNVKYVEEIRKVG